MDEDIEEKGKFTVRGRHVIGIIALSFFIVYLLSLLRPYLSDPLVPQPSENVDTLSG